MIIKVKNIDENVMPKGRAYTYKSDIEVKEGDLIVADMAGHDKILVVVDTGIDQSEIEGVDYEIKTINGFASDFKVEENPKLDIVIKKESLPVIEINFDEMKKALSDTLKKYKGIVVTEQTLKGCKTTQKELAGVRVKIDTYRKEKKKVLSQPIVDFENQCKELIALIEGAEQPIKDGIKVFDDAKREEKRTAAQRLILEVVEEQELSPKYAGRLDVSEKYCNLSAKDSEVKSDLSARAMVLRVEQDREQELIEIIKDSIDAENEKIDSKLEYKDFARLIDRGMATKDILAEVKSRAGSIYRAENPPVKEPVVIHEVLVPKEVPQIEESQTLAEEEPTYYAVLRISGGLDKLKSVSQFIKASGIPYSVIEQGEI